MTAQARRARSKYYSTLISKWQCWKPRVGGILRSGLWLGHVVGQRRAQRLERPPGLFGVDTVEQLAEFKRVLIEAVSPEGYGVLNADDPLVAQMADYCPGKVIYFRMDNHPRSCRRTSH